MSEPQKPLKEYQKYFIQLYKIFSGGRDERKAYDTEFAEWLEVGDGPLNYWIHGKRKPSPESCKIISLALMKHKIPDPYRIFDVCGHERQYIATTDGQKIVIESWWLLDKKDIDYIVEQGKAKLKEKMTKA